ncbi:DUF3987 domain-containing protein [Azospirillum thermophilum]|uniref:DUF3987 domain-containing protein n=1 Tax=Azospirillum thermophilum TaxID=2202148 RepID=UPI001B3BF94E|nr:YfjI family protein [Azospirillum thermophilum]
MVDAYAPLTVAERATLAPAASARPIWETILPVPEDAPRSIPPHRLGKPSAKWTYRNPAGKLLGLVCRFDHEGGKDVLPLTYCRNGATGETAWCWQALPVSRPLYGLDRMADRPDAPVLVTEGEKTADAAERLFPDHVAVTSPGGSKAATKADWTPLRGRHVTVWPDADEPGRAYAEEVARLALAAGAASVRMVDAPMVEWPTGWDLADDPPPDTSPEDLRAMLDGARQVEGFGPPGIGGDDWPPLVELDAPTLPRLDRAVLPCWAGEFAAWLADATETPVELAAAMVLAACATAAARRFRVMVRPGYFEPTNLWIAAALPPGNRKSAVQSNAAAPLLAWEREEADRLADAIKAAISDVKTAEARAKELRAKAAKAADDTEARDLAAQAAAIEADMPEVPRAPQLWTSDVTPERLGMILAEHGERIAWLSSEGGIFDLLAGRYSGGVPNLDLILKAHSGDSERVDRAGRPPVFLAHPLLTVGLSPQPDVLRGLSSKPGFRGRGLLGRFLFLLPPSPLGNRTLNAPPMPDRVASAYAAGLCAILDVPPAVGDEGEERPHLLRLAPDACAEWLAFARHIETTMRPGGEFEHATDWAGKAPGAAIRLAGVLHVIETVQAQAWGRDISLDTMARALNIMAVFAKHSRAALDLMGADEGTAAARKVWEWINAGRRECFAVRDAFNALKGSFPAWRWSGLHSKP